MPQEQQAYAAIASEIRDSANLLEEQLEAKLEEAGLSMTVYRAMEAQSAGSGGAELKSSNPHP